MATLNTTVKVVEGNFTRFNNILSTLTTGDALDFRQITATDAVTANSAGTALTFTTDIGDAGLCVVENQSATKKGYFIQGTTADLGADDYVVAPPSSAVLIYLKPTTAALSFACEDATDVDFKVYVHED